MLKFIKGDATCPQMAGKKIIAHICNVNNAWGAGFVLAISKRWKEPEGKYREWARSKNHFELGEVQFVDVGQFIVIANMLAQKGFGGVAVQYDALKSCMEKVANEALESKASLHVPKMGCGLAGGDIKIIKKMIEECWCDKGIDVIMYLLTHEEVKECEDA
jgi:O-acetyl-ADP-ribose deacetylase (regulator of RNase III)